MMTVGSIPFLSIGIREAMTGTDRLLNDDGDRKEREELPPASAQSHALVERDRSKTRGD